MRKASKLWLTKCEENAPIPLGNPLSPETLHMIEKDVPRVGWKSSDRRVKVLQGLLERITRRLPSYNQALSFIAAFAIEQLEDDDEAAEKVVCNILFHHRIFLLLWTRTCFLQQFVDRFDFLFARVMPDLYMKFSQAKFETMFFGVDWFTTCFTNTLSKECCSLVWDVLIVDELEDALFLCGLAVLKALESQFLKYEHDEFFLDFKRATRENLTIQAFRVELQGLVRTLVPSLIPRGHSTIATLESRLHDPNDVLVQNPFDATFLMRATQSDDSKRIKLETSKYRFPSALLDYALFRAVLLGHTRSVDALLSTGLARADCFSELLKGHSAYTMATVLGHGNTLRCLLAWSDFNGSPGGSARHQDQLIVLANLVKLVREESGDDDAWHGTTLVVEQKCCLWCASTSHKTSACTQIGTFSIGFGNGQCCTRCEISLQNQKRKRRAFICARCQNTFCDRCANTFRTVNDKAFRACTTCHHFWGSCSCILNENKICDHASADFLSPDSSVCECEVCFTTFIRMRGRLFFDPTFVQKIEGQAQEVLDQVTTCIRSIGIKGVEEKNDLPQYS